jgi:cytochrome c5
MKPLALTLAAAGVSLALAGEAAGPEVSRPMAMYVAPEHPTAPADVDPNALVEETCVRCHSDARLRGNLSLEGFDIGAADDNPEVVERMIRKVRAGMMPPPGTRAPEGDTLMQFVETLERTMDRARSRAPNPGRRTFQRLNRPEYEQAIRDLLDLEVKAEQWLPLDQMSANFDNIADVQALSPMLLEAYLNAASDISRMALGDRNAPSINVTYRNSQYQSQHPWDQVEGAPYGTRGGMVVQHVFPADGEYTFGMAFASGDNTRFEDIDISVDGERVALMAYTRSGEAADGRGGGALWTEPVFVRAGQRAISAAFIRRSDGPYEDLIRPHDWSMAGGGSGGEGITTLPHLQEFVVGGPHEATGISETSSRRRIFVCRPTQPSEEEACARQIVESLVTRAYRRPASDDDVDGLMDFYRAGQARGGFERGVRDALEALLASPFFVLRLEREPSNAKPGEAYRLGDTELASRLSFFLWGTPPDAELLAAAEAGRLTDERELERQTRRMMADPRAEALGTRFAAQWLRLQDLYKVRPDPNFFPNFDETLADAMRTETEMFFNHLVQADRDALELFNANYTFVNERLATHYGLQGVAGRQFRRVEYQDGARSGLLGQGSVLVLTSLANRTSPVLRGKWVMEVLMGTPPPPPPPGVPDLEETEGTQEGKRLTTRERMEMHRANPTCNACHRFMDPIGLALDNFDVTGTWRVRENGMALDTRGEFYDGTAITTPKEVADALLKRPVPLMRSLTENLMAYALARRVEYYDQPTIRRIVDEAEDDGVYRMQSLILGVVRSDAFRMKQAAMAVTDQGSPGAQQH